MRKHTHGTPELRTNTRTSQIPWNKVVLRPPQTPLPPSTRRGGNFKYFFCSPLV